MARQAFCRPTLFKKLAKPLPEAIFNPGGQREHTPALIRSKHPERLIEHAVRGMLPKNTLGRELFRSLHVYTGAEHPHQAQQPKELKF